MKFTHFNDEGRAHMVNVSDKQDTQRVAVAVGFIEMQAETLRMILEEKGTKRCSCSGSSSEE